MRKMYTCAPDLCGLFFISIRDHCIRQMHFQSFKQEKMQYEPHQTTNNRNRQLVLSLHGITSTFRLRKCLSREKQISLTLLKDMSSVGANLSVDL